MRQRPLLAAALALGASASLPAQASLVGSTYCDGQLVITRVYSTPSANPGPLVPWTDYHIVLQNNGGPVMVVVYGAFPGSPVFPSVPRGQILDFVFMTVPTGLTPTLNPNFGCQRQ